MRKREEIRRREKTREFKGESIANRKGDIEIRKQVNESIYATQVEPVSICKRSSRFDRIKRISTKQSADLGISCFFALRNRL